MSLTYHPPFPIPRWQRGCERDPAFVEALDRLQRAVAGGDLEIDAVRAVTLLGKTGWPGTAALLRDVVADRGRLVEVRIAAAENLWRNSMPDALGIELVGDAGEEPRLRAAIVTRIGRFGTAPVLPVLPKAERGGGRRLERAVRLAEVLIVHRHDLPLHTKPTAPDQESIPGRGRAALRIDRADEAGVAAALEGLDRAPTGIRPAPDRVYRVTCTSKRMLLMFQGDGPTPASLARRKAVLGIVVELDEANGQWTPAFYLLTRPEGTGDRVKLELPRFSGRPFAFGRGRVLCGTLHFEIVGIRGAAGAFPLDLSGALDSDYRLRLNTAEVGLATDKIETMAYFPPPLQPRS